MAYQTQETVFLYGRNDAEIELDVTVTWQPAEPDVGIGQDYIDHVCIDRVNNDKRLGRLLNRLCQHELENNLINKIYDQQ